MCVYIIYVMVYRQRCVLNKTMLYIQLEEHVVRLRDELDRERDERNFFQLERDKVNTFWDITKRQLEETRATVRIKERELEEADERHQVEIKV